MSLHPFLAKLLSVPDGQILSFRSGDRITNYSRSEFLDLAYRYASGVSAHSSPNDLVWLATHQGIETPALFLACLLQGRIPAVIAHPSHKVKPSEFLKKCKSLEQVMSPGLIVCQDSDVSMFAAFSERAVSASGLKSGRACAPEAVEEPCFAQFSSGSTGTPKPMLYTLTQLQDHLDDFITALAWDFEARMISWLPLYHDMGLIAGLMLPLYAGYRAHYLDPFEWVSNPKSLLLDAERLHCNVTWMPNFAFALLSARCRNLTASLAHWRCLSSCAEPVSAHTVSEFYKTFAPLGLRADALAVTYAMAENIFAMTHGTLDFSCNHWSLPHPYGDTLGRVVSCGWPLMKTEVRIGNPDSEGVGEIEIRSPYALRSYWSMPDIVDENGWFNTKDKGFISNERLFVCGRSSDMIVSHGVNLFPQAVEVIVDEVASVVPGRNVCLGIYDESLGTEQLLVLAETRDYFRRIEVENAIREQVVQRLDLVPQQVRVVPYQWLIKTSSGKMARKPNLARFQDLIKRRCLVLGCSHIYAFNSSDELYNQHSTAVNLCLEQVPIASCLNIFTEPRRSQIRRTILAQPAGSLILFMIGEQDNRTVMSFWQRHEGISRQECSRRVVELYNLFLNELSKDCCDYEFGWFFPPPPGEGLKPHPRFVAKTELSDELYYHYLSDQDARRQNALALLQECRRSLTVPVLDIWDSICTSEAGVISPEFVRDNSHVARVYPLLYHTIESKFSILFGPEKQNPPLQRKVVKELGLAQEICDLIRRLFSAPVEPVTNILHVLNSVDIVRLLGALSDTYAVELPSTWLDKSEIETPLKIVKWLLKARVDET